MFSLRGSYVDISAHILKCQRIICKSFNYLQNLQPHFLSFHMWKIPWKLKENIHFNQEGTDTHVFLDT